MNLVIDTSILIAVIANEPVKGRLTAVTQQADLIAPGSVHWEVGNALSAMMRRKRISGEQAAKALLSYQQIPIRFVAVPLDESLQLAEKFGIYAYDAYLIAAAQMYLAPLMTLDLQLGRTAAQTGIEVLEVV